MVQDLGSITLGKLFKSLKNPQWYFQQAAETAFSIYVINPAGKKVAAYVKGHLLHQDQKVGDVMHCQDGHEYIHVHGKTYYHDTYSDTWVDSTH